MRIRRGTGWWLFATAAALVLALAGCRAFEPEAVIVNKAPETFIIGAPLEEGGGYYHFHVFWYGSDADGRVERFVWALTDTTVQDDETTEDEEDQRFNPALDATTLEIGHWTTRTDSIFDFRIDQGVQPSYDMTLHIAALDDFGDFDRTPARLHFFSNTLGTPAIRFFRIDGPDTVPIAAGESDTVGFGHSYHLYWSGATPNIRGYDQTALARVDTMPPFTDGLLGYKWQILGQLGGNCVPTLEDCWHPRLPNEATGDSFSYFAPRADLLFLNSVAGSINPFEKLLDSGNVRIEVNSIDVAGVEVANYLRSFQFVVNYDPQTLMVVGRDPFHPEDAQEYPYYILLNDPAQERHPFAPGERIPDRTYVVVKALARDDPRDAKLDQEFGIGVTGYLRGLRTNFTGGDFGFTTETSATNYEPTWASEELNGWYADTLGFLTAPSTEFTIAMQAVDEHGRRDGSPATLSFDVGYPPCLQCIEVLPKSFSTSAYDADLACYQGLDDEGDPIASHPCFDAPSEYRITFNGLGPNELEYVGQAVILVDKATGFTQTVTDTTGLSAANYAIGARLYRMEVFLHGRDDERERWANPAWRTMGWRYQVDYDCDPFNLIKDGGGNDDLTEPTWGAGGGSTGLAIDNATGLWKLSIDLAVPTDLVQSGPGHYRDFYLLLLVAGNDPVLAQELFEKTTRQTGAGTIRAVALDQTYCGIAPTTRPATYNLFRYVRPTVAELASNLTWRSCNLTSYVQDIQMKLDLSFGAMASLGGEAATKHFRVIVSTPEGDYECLSSGGF